VKNKKRPSNTSEFDTSPKQGNNTDRKKRGSVLDIRLSKDLFNRQKSNKSRISDVRKSDDSEKSKTNLRVKNIFEDAFKDKTLGQSSGYIHTSLNDLSMDMEDIRASKIDTYNMDN
jgi:hypothetical protein